MTMKIKDFKQLIKTMSSYRVDKRKGDYMVRGGINLSQYLENMIHDFLTLNELHVVIYGDMYIKTINKSSEYTTETQKEYIKTIVKDMLYMKRG